MTPCQPPSLSADVPNRRFPDRGRSRVRGRRESAMLRGMRLLALTVLAFAALASPAPAKTTWLCHPGLAADPCRASLETTVFSPWDQRRGWSGRGARGGRRSTASTSTRRSPTRRPTRSPQHRPPAIDAVPGRAVRAVLPCLRAGLPAGDGRGDPAAGRRRVRDDAYGDVHAAWRRVPRPRQPRSRLGPDRPLAGHRHLTPAHPDPHRPLAARGSGVGWCRRSCSVATSAVLHARPGRRRLVPHVPPARLRAVSRMRGRVLDVRRDAAGRGALRPRPQLPRRAAARRRAVRGALHQPRGARRRLGRAGRDPPVGSVRPRVDRGRHLAAPAPAPAGVDDLHRGQERLHGPLLDRGGRELPRDHAACRDAAPQPSPDANWGLHLVDGNVALDSVDLGGRQIARDEGRRG